MTTWLDRCREFADRHGVDPRDVRALEAFAHPHPRGGPPAPAEMRFAESFVALETILCSTDSTLQAVGDDLVEEVDADQARTFARRLSTVDRMLANFDDPTGRILRVGLRHRLVGILQAPRPRASRVRALADFFYSFAGRHEHRRRDAGERRPWSAALPSLRWSPVADGIQSATLEGIFIDGPVHVNLLRLDPGTVRVRAEDLRRDVARGLSFAASVDQRNAIAATSGGFFLYSETDIRPPERRFDPVGLLVHAGEVLSPPVFPRGAVVVDDEGRWSIGRIGTRGLALQTPRGESIGLDRIWTRAEHRQGPSAASVSVAGRRVVAVGHELPIPLGGFVVERPPRVRLDPGEAVRFVGLRDAAGRPIMEGIAGGPMLVEQGRRCLDLRAEGFWGTAPPITFSQDETGDLNLLPRLAVGIDERRRLLLAAVDGRNLERALGMTMRDVGALMQGLRCTTVTNLDGGSSKRMLVRGETLDLSTTEIAADGAEPVSVRPVHTALMFDPGYRPL